MGWGRGGMVGVRKTIWQHERTLRVVEILLEAGHGKEGLPGSHKPGERLNDCPTCKSNAAREDFDVRR